MIKAKVCGPRVQSVILLMVVGCETNVETDDWMVWNGYQDSKDEEESPINSLYPLSYPPTSLTMSHSNLCDLASFEFHTGQVAGKTITSWDCHSFPCAAVDSTVPYPSNKQVHFLWC